MSKVSRSGIGRNLIRLRRKRKLTQAELARRADLTASCVCSIEKGKNAPRVETWNRLAKALGVEPSELMSA